MAPIAIRNGQQTFGASVFWIVWTNPFFSLFEIRQHFCVRPARVTQGEPSVIICRLTTGVVKSINRTRSTQRTPHPSDHATTMRLRTRFRLKIPRIGGIMPDFNKASRNMNKWISVRRTCLEQANRHGRILCQPVRQQAASCARPDDNVIVCPHDAFLSVPSGGTCCKHFI